MFCRNCGKEITDGSPFCPECGAKQEDAAKAKQSNSVKYSVPVYKSHFKLAPFNVFSIMGNIALTIAVILLILQISNVNGELYFKKNYYNLSIISAIVAIALGSYGSFNADRKNERIIPLIRFFSFVLLIFQFFLRLDQSNTFI